MDWFVILRNALAAFVGQDAVIYALGAIGLNLHFGYTGLLNFGQVGFLAAGAYGVAVSVATFNLPLWTGLAVGIGAALLLAVLLGVPTLRLRADYLAIVTIATSEILRLSVRSVSARQYTGGSFGLGQFAGDFYALNPFAPGNYGIGPLVFSARQAWLLLVGWSLVALSALLIWLWMRSPWGRVLKSIREDEDAARSLGKNVFVYKMQSLAFGGVFGALGGFVFALGNASVQPDAYSTPVTFFIWTALILGGTATLLGPIVGAMLFWALLSLTDNLLRQAVGAGYIPPTVLDGVQIGQVRFMLVGLGLMLLMIFRPQGLFGDKRELALDAR